MWILLRSRLFWWSNRGKSGSRSVIEVRLYYFQLVTDIGLSDNIIPEIVLFQAKMVTFYTLFQTSGQNIIREISLKSAQVYPKTSQNCAKFYTLLASSYLPLVYKSADFTVKRDDLCHKIRNNTAVYLVSEHVQS